VPKLCDNGCSRIAESGRLILIDGSKKTVLMLCSVCRDKTLRGKNDYKTANRVDSEHASSSDGSRKNRP
jgi:hypothetical protein